MMPTAMAQSELDYYYYDRYENTDDDEEDCDDDQPYETAETRDYHAKKMNRFTILTKEDLLSRIDDDVLQVSSLLSISRQAAKTLLCRHNWDVAAVCQEWLEDAFLVHKTEEPIDDDDDDDDDDVVEYDAAADEIDFVCRVCLESYPIALAVMTSAACRHVFCGACWKNHITISINDGNGKEGDDGCLTLRCPQESCGVAVGRNIVNALASDEDKKKYDEDRNKYDRYVARSYVENKENIKLCPTPGCGCLIEYDNSGGNGGLTKNFDVNCNCWYRFCWNCLGEAHSPVDCRTVAKWTVKNSSDLETQNWLLANTMPCSKCHNLIENTEKDGFCWLCYGRWQEHDWGTCGVFNCKICNKAVEEEGVFDEVEREKQRAKEFWCYYERWYSNHYSMERAFLDLHQMKNVNVEKLSEIQGVDETELGFIIDAWIQIAECRRFFKWASVYGYYLPRNEHDNKKAFFDYLMMEAEATFETLHQCAEKELLKYLQEKCPEDNFYNFRTKLAGLTRVTRIYFDNLVATLENDGQLFTTESN